MKYVLDTNIAIIYLRSKEQKKLLENKYGLFLPQNKAIISAVTIGEILSIARRNKWGARRLRNLKIFLNELLIVGVNFTPLLEAYAEIDTFSQGKHENKVTNFSARNMGKNDLWIAATAYISEATLLTTDKDFLHLDGKYFKIILVEQS